MKPLVFSFSLVLLLTNTALAQLTNAGPNFPTLPLPLSQAPGMPSKTTIVKPLSWKPLATGLNVVQWDFNGTLAPTLGSTNLIAGFAAPAGSAGVTFSNLLINGQTARVASFTRGTFFQLAHLIPANGGGSKLNRYTLMMDVMFPSRPAGVFTSLFQTSASNSDDGEWFINPAGALYLNGSVGGSVPDGVWHRLTIVVDVGANILKTYSDGVLAASNVPGAVDGRFAAGSTVLLFADETSENAAGFVNSVQLRDVALSDAAVASFGGPQAAGIPVVPVDTSFTSDRWIPMGPAPIQNGYNNHLPGRVIDGCVEAVAAHPTDPNIMYIAAVNGGVWKTTNATSSNVSWKPLTDDQRTSSFGFLEFDPTDGTRQTLVAGTARRSAFAQVGGDLIGLLRTSDGGNSWTGLGTYSLSSLHVVSVAARGSIIMAAGFDLNGTNGLYRSINTGADFVSVSGTGGLPIGSVTSLVGDPGVPTRFYAAVPPTGLFRSENSGVTWINISAGVNLTGITSAKFAVHTGATNVVFVGVQNSGSVQFYRSTNMGTNWTAMDSAPVGSGDLQYAVAADPTNANLCYTAGTLGFGTQSSICRGDASKTPGTQFTPLAGEPPGTSPHSDSRAIVFDANGSMIEADDGGINRLATPAVSANGTNAAGGWTSLLGNLQITEMHSIAYDSLNRIALLGAQDNGDAQQIYPGSFAWEGTVGGDGGVVQVDNTSTPGRSIRYISYLALIVLQRTTYDSNNVVISSVYPTLTTTNGAPLIANIAPAGNMPFYPPLALNAINAKRVLIGGNTNLYESFDQMDNVSEITKLGGANANTRMVYGGRSGATAFPEILYVGNGSRILRRSAGQTVVTTNAAPFPGGTVLAITANPTNWQNIVAVGSSGVYSSVNAGDAWQNITGNLTGVGNFRWVEFLPLPVGDTLAVGTDLGVFIMSLSAPGVWRTLGDSLPTAPVFSMQYVASEQILVVGTLGRGAWKFNFSNTPTNDFMVTSLADSGSGTLRELMTIANASGIPTTVNFATNGTLTLVSPLPPAVVGLTLNGNGTNLTIISGGNETRLFTFNAGTTNILRNLTLANATSAGSAAAIINLGALTLANTVVSNCAALASLGGAIYNGGSLTASNTLFSANTIYGGAGISGGGNSGPGGGGAGMGGAIFYEGTNLDLINCTFSLNNAVGGNGATGDANGFGNDPGANGGSPNAGLGGPVGSPGGTGGFGGGGGGGAGSFGSGGFAGGVGGVGGGGGGGGANGSGGSGGTGGAGGLYGGVGGAAQSSHSGGGGGGAGLGGAIFVRGGDISVTGCSFIQNSATNGTGGGGSFGGGNGATGQGFGGAILNYGGSICLGGSTLTGNTASSGGPSIAFGPTGGLVADGETCVVDGFTFDLSTNTLFVGKSGPNTTLIITNAGKVFNGDGTVGDFGGANSNLVLVTGSGSVWSNTGTLKIGGAFVSGNRLVVSNAARVTSATGIIGSQSDNNSVLVTSGGSVWTNSGPLYVGSAGGTGNQLTVAGGGEMDSQDAFIGYNPGVNNNLALVTGSNSLLRISSGIYAGVFGSANRLVVSNGATARSGFGTLGYAAGSVSNLALITGAGSRWLDTGTLTVGRDASWNQLIVNNGGSLSNSAALNLGESPNSTNNLLAVSGGSVLVTNGPLDVRRGGVLFNGGSITTDNLLVTNPGASSFTFNDGTLVTRAATIANSSPFMVGANAGTPAGATFANGSLILIPATGTVGPANPYPSTIGVSNLIGGIAKVTVTISNLSHTYPADLEILLVSPGGESAMLMSSAGGGGPGVSGVTVTFDDAAATTVPQVNFPGGSYRPTNYFGLIPPLPAPQGPHGATLATLNGLNPNGTWSLFVNDHSGGDLGALTNGWSLKITTSPAATWDVRGSTAPTTVTGELHIGENGSNARLLVTNGANLFVSGDSYVGTQGGSSNNVVVVSGANSTWTNNGSFLSVGQNGSFNTLLITNGGRVQINQGYVGAQVSANNRVIVSGTNSAWQNNSWLFVGYVGSGNSLLITDGGSVQAFQCFLGTQPTSANNRLTVDGGTLRSTNVGSNGLLDIRRGTNVMAAGLIEVDNLLLTNTAGFFEFNGGTLNASAATVANGTLFTVGNGSSAATYRMTGATASAHSFASGLRIANNATLAGNGTISGTLTVASGGTLAPGSSVGKIILNNSPSLQGSVAMEISKNGSVRTNDSLNVSGTLTYGGSLTVSNLGPTPLALGDSFTLFQSFTGYGGVFTTITLPTLPPGLSWTNQLLASGSITVIGNPVPGLGGVTQAGTNLFMNATNGAPGGTWKLLTSTNVILPVASWNTNSSGVFDGLGNVAVTNGINFTEPQRFYRIKVP